MSNLRVRWHGSKYASTCIISYIDRCKTIPGLKNRSRSEISRQKSRGGSGNYCFNSLSVVKRQILNMACWKGCHRASPTIDLYFHKCNPDAKMWSVGATNSYAAISLQLAWAKWHFWIFTSFLFACFLSLQEMFYICGIIQESMSGVILMGEFKI